LKKELEEKNFELTMLKQRHLVEIDRVKDNVTQAMNVKLQGQLDKQFRIYDNEKAELYLQIRELEKAAGNYN
jgi:hypothetical protein